MQIRIPHSLSLPEVLNDPSLLRNCTVEGAGEVVQLGDALEQNEDGVSRGCRGCVCTMMQRPISQADPLVICRTIYRTPCRPASRQPNHLGNLPWGCLHLRLRCLSLHDTFQCNLDLALTMPFMGSPSCRESCNL